ncbi:hypothetical protein [Nocardia sp. NPDC051832]
MSAVAVLLIVGFICGLLAIRFLGARQEDTRTVTRWRSATPGRAMMDR